MNKEIIDSTNQHLDFIEWNWVKNIVYSSEDELGLIFKDIQKNIPTSEQFLANLKQFNPKNYSKLWRKYTKVKQLQNSYKNRRVIKSIENRLEWEIMPLFYSKKQKNIRKDSDTYALMADGSIIEYAYIENYEDLKNDLDAKFLWYGIFWEYR